MTQDQTYNTIETDLADGWLTIWLNRPETRNALSGEMIEELTGLLRSVENNRDIRGITFRGRGGFFCAGGDIKGFLKLHQKGEPSHEDVAASSKEAGRFFGLVARMPQVVVMLVEGAAVAGGMGLVCTGDIVISTEDAKFALTETTLGIPPAQIAPFVANRIGLNHARRLMLTAARFDGAEAARIGLADYAVKDVASAQEQEAAIKAAVLKCSANANAVTKDIIQATQQLDRDAMVDYAANGFATCMLSEDGREGVTAFIEKRPPSWVAK